MSKFKFSPRDYDTVVQILNRQLNPSVVILGWDFLLRYRFLKKIDIKRLNIQKPLYDENNNTTYFYMYMNAKRNKLLKTVVERFNLINCNDDWTSHEITFKYMGNLKELITLIKLMGLKE